MDSANTSLNKWELEATAKPLTSGEGIVGIAALVTFGAIFLVIIAGSLYGAFGPEQHGGLAEQYQEKLGGGTTPAAAPAEAAPAEAAP
ncbi:MAG: hypothetical protein ACPHRO_06895 [Nannocystaceae bacterium]